jgi:hypothetical protein
MACGCWRRVLRRIRNRFWTGTAIAVAIRKTERRMVSPTVLEHGVD